MRSYTGPAVGPLNDNVVIAASTPQLLGLRLCPCLGSLVDPLLEAAVQVPVAHAKILGDVLEALALDGFAFAAIEDTLQESLLDLVDEDLLTSFVRVAAADVRLASLAGSVAKSIGFS